MINHPDSEITVIEGNWQIGKSSLMKFLGQNGYRKLSEPLQTKAVEEQFDLDEWYAKQHLTNLEAAITNSSPCVIERSLASNLAFMKTLSLDGSVKNEKKIARMVRDSKRSGLLERVGTVIFMQVDTGTYMDRRVAELKDPTIVPFLLDMKQQFSEYQYYLQEFVSLLFPHARIANIMSYGRQGFESRDEIYTQVERQVEGVV